MKYLKNYNTFILESHDYNGQELTTLVGLNIPEIVDGYFYCDNNELISLEGAPKKVTVSFNCRHNYLTSLEYAPKYVGDNFNCDDNELISLKGVPEYIGGYFDCSCNKLMTLDYFPEYIGGVMWCCNNNWIKPIPYKIMITYNLHCISEDNSEFLWVYTQEQFDKFSSFEYQKEFLEREPENFMDLKPIGYTKGIEDLFPHLFDMDELGLID